MRRLREKLNSESGASILLALLLFLVCCMVAASILAAVMSNAGKVRSNQAEQQKYLTLSSAIQLVADEIEKVEYEWKYTVYEWEVTPEEEDETASSSTEYFFYCEQEEGSYTDTDGSGIGDLQDQIPLGKWLDWELWKQFDNAGSGYKPLVATDFIDTDYDKNVGTTITRNLLVTLQPDNLEGYTYPGSGSSMAVYQVPNEVTVRVELNHATRHITLTAWLGTATDPPTDVSNTMIAELVAAGDVPQLDYRNPGYRTAKDAAPAADSGAVSWTTEKTMKWKLNWIKKGGL